MTNALCGLLIVFFVIFVCKHLTMGKDILFNRHLYNLALSTTLNFIIVNFINGTIYSTIVLYYSAAVLFFYKVLFIEKLYKQ